MLFSGQVLSQLGDAIYEVGIVWLVYQLSHSATALGVLALCQSIWATASFGSESLSAAIAGPLLGLIALPVAMSGAGTLLLFLGLVPLIKLRKTGQNRVDRRTV